ncbi:MAG TPA: carboxypeptidase regulatory-like domain-containing protein, partial [Chitinophagaceae bacterium]|nr:carboxypeptidase regulatory-like domain-containing protein [Chitinophagaceae bacterium]
MKPLIFVCIGLMNVLFVSAQVEREEPPRNEPPVIRINEQVISGKVIDIKSGRGLEAASVQLYAWLPGREQDTLINGMFTKNNGDFTFQNLPQADSFRVFITGVGYREMQKTVTLPQGQQGPVMMDLGNLYIEQESQVLSGVVISTQRPALQMGIDRKIFDVERNLTTTGGTALDVMRNIPSVSVDVEGNVLLRNAQPQVFVDGRPTILTPDQIPADQIERIEL